jgi:hypothetical protein
MSSPPAYSGVLVVRSLVLCILLQDCCVSSCPFFFTIVLSIPLRFTASDYSFGILKLVIKEERVEIPLICLKTTQMCTSANPEPKFP